MAKKVFKDLNLNFEHQVVPWKRTLLNAQKGVIDAIICLSKTEDRLNFLNFSNPIAFAGYYLVTHKDLPEFNPKDKDLINKLSKYRMVMTRGSNVGDKAIQSLIKSKKAVLISKPSNFLHMVAIKRADFTILPKGSIDYLMRNDYKDKLRIYSEPITRKYVYAAVSKKSKRLDIEKLNKSLKKFGYTKDLDIDKLNIE